MRHVPNQRSLTTLISPAWRRSFARPPSPQISIRSDPGTPPAARRAADLLPVVADAAPVAPDIARREPSPKPPASGQCSGVGEK